jgi:hypothetical protein
MPEAEFEMSFVVESSKYGEMVVVQKYGDDYKLLAGKASKRADGTPWLKWVYPQGIDKKPIEKAIPLQINLGSINDARSILTRILNALPAGAQAAQTKPKGDDGSIPF